ncbi:MAG: DJ-1/PfpI family protein [Xanthomonadales bacterium]|nr:DJ-1/PfpI family protein [Xanthomonadales bacterium]
MSFDTGATFGFLLFDGAEELDFAGPWELAGLWSRHAGGPTHCLVVSESGGPVNCAQGLKVHADAAFEDCPNLDYLLIPGGEGTRKAVNNPALLAFISAQARHCRSLLSVCTGSLVLQAAGLLEGRQATTYWGLLDTLRQRGVEVVEERFVHDDPVWTSAGVSAGMDMLLAFIAHTAGEDTAAQVQFLAEYYPDDQVYGTPGDHPQAPAYVRRRSDKSR